MLISSSVRLKGLGKLGSFFSGNFQAGNISTFGLANEKDLYCRENYIRYMFVI